MKNSLPILFLLILLYTQSFAQSNKNDILLKDSILNEYNSMPKDTLRIIKLQDLANQYIGHSWSIELFDTLIAASRELNFPNGELKALFSRCNYYAYQSDTLHMRISFEMLGKASEMHNSYNRYFSMWRVLGEYKSKRGETEAVILEAERMKAKAIALKEKSGLYYANLMKAEALTVSKRNEEVLRIYNEILEDKELDKHKRSEIHWRNYHIHYDNKDYLAAIREIDISTKLYQEFYAESRNIPPNKHTLLQKELGLCKVYAAIPEPDKLYEHLKRAKTYYTPNTHHSLRVTYHLHWALYHNFKNEWEECFSMFDKTFAEFKGSMPLYEMSLHRLKGEILERAERYKEAAETYRYAAQINDSINQEIIRLHEEVHQSNYLINQNLLEKSIIEKRHNRLKIILSILVSIILIGILIKIIDTHGKLKRTKGETNKLLQIAQTTNKKKEVFLHTITHQIRVPLNTIVGFAEVLVYEKSLTPKEVEIINKTIKEDAEQLSKLIFDVLYLSRLEAGMMPLNLQYYNLPDLCKEVINEVNIENSTNNRYLLHGCDEIIMAETDKELFIKMIHSILEEGKEKGSIVVSCSVMKKEKEELTIRFEMNPLSEEEEIKNRVQHAINRAFISTLKGSYTIEQSKKKRLIQITMFNKGKSANN
ncbi:MAG: histidine kinase dimerization/phospho-acceptor domain-containing protein [Phocaeicola sp.]